MNAKSGKTLDLKNKTIKQSVDAKKKVMKT